MVKMPIYLRVLPPELLAYVWKHWRQYRKFSKEFMAMVEKGDKDALPYAKAGCSKNLTFFCSWTHGTTAKQLKLEWSSMWDGKLIPGLHGVIAALFQYMIDEKKQIGLMIPRDHGKTLIFGCWGIEWLALHPDKIRAPEWSYITASGKLAARKGDYIRKDLEWHPRIQMLFGSQRKSGYTWNQDRIETAQGFIINFAGAGEQTRGPHPGGATVDDIDSSETARSETMTDNNKEWMWADFYGQLEPGDPLGVIGTNNGRATMLDELFFDPTSNGPKPGFTLVKVRSCDVVKHSSRLQDYEIVDPIWPKKFTADALKQRLLTMGEWAFDREMQNEPHGVDEPIFRIEWIRDNEVVESQAPRAEEVDCIIAYDPAWRGQEVNDYCGWCEIWVSKRRQDFGTAYVMELDHRKMTSDELAAQMVYRDMILPQPEGIWLETDANQKYLHDYLVQKTALLGRMPNIQEINTEGKDKGARGSSVQGLVQSGRVKFIRGKYPGGIDEIVNFSPRRKSGSHDDMYDAWVYALKVVQKRHFPMAEAKPPPDEKDFLKDVRQKMNQDKLKSKLTGEGSKKVHPITGEVIRWSP